MSKETTIMLEEIESLSWKAADIFVNIKDVRDFLMKNADLEEKFIIAEAESHATSLYLSLKKASDIFSRKTTLFNNENKGSN